MYGIVKMEGDNTDTTINVDGASNMKVSPDLVSIYFNAQTKGATSKEANDANSIMTDKLITALIKQGFERKDIQTESFNIYEDFDWRDGKQTSKGFIASQQIKVEVYMNESDNIGDVIDAGINAGAMLNYINFELSIANQNKYKAEALRLAAEDAKVKAEAVASGVGKKVGDLVSISTSNYYYTPMNLYSNSGGMVKDEVAVAREATTNIQPSDQDINAQVSAVFKIV
jgi:uncharacterized protein YggE